MTLGFIGTGTIAAAMVEGLGGEDILVSPRGETVAAALAARFPGVRIAASNQAVVEGCETVVLAVRPQVAEEVIRGLRFHPGQRVISAIAATGIDRIKNWIGLDLPVVRTIPLPFVAERRGVTPVFPPDPEVMALFNRMGTAIPCATIEEFDLLAVGSAIMGSYFGILETVQGWLQAQGLPEATARAYLGGILSCLGTVAENSPEGFATLRQEYSTKGGLNEQVFRVFSEQGGREALSSGLESVLARVAGRGK